MLQTRKWAKAALPWPAAVQSHFQRFNLRVAGSDNLLICLLHGGVLICREKRLTVRTACHEYVSSPAGWRRSSLGEEC